MSMNIIAVCRTRNEERNIERFCREYLKIADRVLIADGGSEDRTVEIAREFDRVDVRPFHERVYREGVWRNPQGEHINFMIEWAEGEGADWIIYDDCDSVPNRDLKRFMNSYFESVDLGIQEGADMIAVRRLYLYKDLGHFPQMASVGHAVWAWYADIEVRADESDPWHHHMDFPVSDRIIFVDEPACLLHYSWPDDEEIQRKAAFYEVAKDTHNWHPREFGGPLAPLPEWAVL